MPSRDAPPAPMPRTAFEGGRGGGRGGGARRDRTVLYEEEEQEVRLVGWLVVVQGPEEPAYKDYKLRDGKNPIGRAGDGKSDGIRIREKGISGDHALLVHEGGKYKLMDMGSQNGTWVNEEKIESLMPVVLEDGAEIRIGKTKLIFKPFTHKAL